jgi:lipoprotein-anchoring transpeptidase ErfK/SrfK
MSWYGIPFRRIGVARNGIGNLTATRVIPGLLFLSFCGGCVAPPSTIPQRALPAPSPVAVHQRTTELPDATTFANLLGGIPDPAPSAPTDGTVLHVQGNLAVYNAVGGRAFATLPPTQLGSPTWVPIIARRGEWAQILLPSRPNQSTGWVRTTDPAVGELARSAYTVDVDVDARRLVLRENGREIGVWAVGVGKPVSPTPRGRTFIMASIKETVTHFSPIILPLGTHSETFNTYGGGPGTVALHGWPNSTVFGRASSDGCVRVPADALRLLMSLPLGTIVVLH